MNRSDLPVRTPDYSPPQLVSDAGEALAELQRIYDTGTQFLRDRFSEIMDGKQIEARFRAYYPEIRIATASYANVDSASPTVMFPVPANSSRPSPGRTCSPPI